MLFNIKKESGMFIYYVVFALGVLVSSALGMEKSLLELRPMGIQEIKKGESVIGYFEYDGDLENIPGAALYYLYDKNNGRKDLSLGLLTRPNPDKNGHRSNSDFKIKNATTLQVVAELLEALCPQDVIVIREIHKSDILKVIQKK